MDYIWISWESCLLNKFSGYLVNDDEGLQTSHSLKTMCGHATCLEAIFFEKPYNLQNV